jgi:hypothetical protein
MYNRVVLKAGSVWLAASAMALMSANKSGKWASAGGNNF